ncbi:MAG: CpaF family protein [Lachnospiraceae bacterium]|nr:CpaF family protein [Lachnospiraceae bacterium]
MCVRELRSQIIERIDVTKEIEDDKIYDIIDEVLGEYNRSRHLTVKERCKLKKEIFDSIRGLDILEDMLNDKDITEIMINGHDNIFVEKNGELMRYSDSFSSQERLEDVIQQIVAETNRRVNESSPIVDSRLKDGSRVNVVLAPIALEGSTVTIRKFPEQRITMEKLIEINSITKQAAEFLRVLVVSGYNIFISGGTGSGKTTFLNALSNYIPESERIITIEDSAELQLQNISNLVRLEARQPNVEGENGISIRELIKCSLRMRPDRIIVGEVRGSEALDMLQAMNTGHDGSLSTGHANSPKDMLSRLETMVLMGMEMPLAAIKSQIAAGIDIIVHLGRLRDRTRKVLEIVEIVGYTNSEIVTNTLFQFCENLNETQIQNKVNGALKWSGKLINTTKLENAGFKKEARLYGESD